MPAKYDMKLYELTDDAPLEKLFRKLVMSATKYVRVPFKTMGKIGRVDRTDRDEGVQAHDDHASVTIWKFPPVPNATTPRDRKGRVHVILRTHMDLKDDIIKWVQSVHQEHEIERISERTEPDKDVARWEFAVYP